MKLSVQKGMNNSILRTLSTPITVFNQEIQELDRNMRETMKKERGVGLAAPQVGKNIRMIIAEIDENSILTLCNPIVISHAETTILDEEGCLSLPGVFELIPRYTWVTVTYQDVYGVFTTATFKDFPARIIQHEMDHLLGILFPDRIENAYLKENISSL